MDQHNNIAYYRRREASARLMAEGSSDESIKCIHLGFADHYATKVRELDPRPTLKIVI